MSQSGWHDCLPSTRAQVERCVVSIQELLADELVGIYLHGSLAMGCFNPAGSDIDLLVVTRHGMSLTTKRSMAELFLRISAAPHPIEISFLAQAQLHPWRYPTPFDFHYSEDWRAAMVEQLADGAWRSWNDAERRDPDLAAHVTITRARGVCLQGAAIADVFLEVPPQHYRTSIVEDLLWAQARTDENATYAVLNACRVLWYLRERRISSKQEAGCWAVEALPTEQRAVVEQALAAYRGDSPAGGVDVAAARRLVRYVVDSLPG